MSIVAETVEHVVGIDTHARTYCLVHARTGAVVDTATFRRRSPATPGRSIGSSAVARAASWPRSRAPPPTAPGSAELC